MRFHCRFSILNNQLSCTSLSLAQFMNLWKKKQVSRDKSTTTSLESVSSDLAAIPNRSALTIFLTLSERGTPNFWARSLALSSAERVPSLTTFLSSLFSESLKAFDSSMAGAVSSLTAGTGTTVAGFLFNTTFLAEVAAVPLAGAFLRCRRNNC